MSAPIGVATDRSPADAEALPVRSLTSILVIDAAALFVFAALAALGVWQLERRVWKLDLIARIEARIHAPATALPPRDRWPQVTAAGDEYRHVEVTGLPLGDRPTYVQAVTALGGGFWVMAPLRRADGTIVFVNRGFVSPDKRDPAAWGTPVAAGPITLTGLLRMSEAGGAFLRANDPASGRWYSRDIQAIAAARGLTDVAPFFIDAEQSPGQTGLPVAGLTVVDFPNNHLVYAITWFTLSLMLGAATIHVNRQYWREQRRRSS